MIREMTSSLTAEDLKEAVIEVFLKDLESPVVKKRLDKESENEKDKQRIFLDGKSKNSSMLLRLKRCSLLEF